MVGMRVGQENSLQTDAGAPDLRGDMFHGGNSRKTRIDQDGLRARTYQVGVCLALERGTLRAGFDPVHAERLRHAKPRPSRQEWCEKTIHKMRPRFELGVRERMVMEEWRQAAGLLIDLDGTLFRGGEIIPGALDFMTEVDRLDIPYLFWTNNSTRTREALAGHLQGLGFPAVPERIYTSANALADTVRVEMGGGGKSAYVIGEAGLREAVESVALIHEEGPADFVAVGLDRGLTYGSLLRATRLLLEGALFLATNADRILPVEDGMAPGAGAILALLETASGRPARVLGKPQPQFVAAACAALGIRPQDTWVIGDNPETDIAAGLAAGATTILVETGVGTIRRGGPQAHFSVPSLLSLLSG